MPRTPVATTLRVYGALMGRAVVRRVWAALTISPNASTRELAKQLGISYGDVGKAVKILRDAGYVQVDGARARRVLIPLYTN